MLSIASECARRGFDRYCIAASSLPDVPIAPGSGHNGVTRQGVAHASGMLEQLLTVRDGSCEGAVTGPFCR